MGIYTNLIIKEHIEKIFYHGLRTNGFVILAGLTGTGKTKLFEQFELYCLEKGINKIKDDILNTEVEAFGQEEDSTGWIWPKNKKKKKIENWIESFKDWLKKEKINEKPEIKHYALKEKGPNLQNIVGLKSDKKYSWISDPNDGLWVKLRKYINLKDLSEVNDLYPHLFRYYFISDKKTGNEYWNRSDLEGKYNQATESETTIEENIKKILKTLSEYILKKQAVEILRDATLKNFFHSDLLKVFAFIANPDEALMYFYCIGELKIPDTLKDKPIKAIKKEFLPIRPEYTESHHLLGYYNPIRGEYKYTKLLKFILEALNEYIEKSRCARPYVVCLDEMNIAQVEYYFADFLSVLQTSRINEESLKNKREKEKIKKIKEDIKNLFSKSEQIKIITIDDIDKFNKKVDDHPLIGVTKEGITLSLDNQDYTLYLPPNLYFVGTINLDETTKSISPKVLDRAFVIEFDCDIEEYFFKKNNQNENTQNELDYLLFTNSGKFYSYSSDDYEKFKSELPYDIKNKIENIWKTLKKYGLHFGYRTLNQICAFIYSGLNDPKVIDKLNFNPPEKALDYAIYSKILPRLAGPEQVLKNPLIELLEELVEDQKPPQPSQTPPESQEAQKSEIRKKLESSPLTFIPKVEKVEKDRDTKNTVETKETKATDETKKTEETEEAKEAEGTYKFSFKLKEEKGSEDFFTTKYPLSVQKILEMLYKLDTYNFASFI